MSRVFSVALIVAHGLKDGRIAYVVPRDRVVVVRDICVYTDALLPRRIDLEGELGQTFYTFSTTSPDAQYGHQDMRAVFEEAETITAHAIGGPFDLTVSGYALTA